MTVLTEDIRPLPEAVLATLRRALAGTVVTPGDVSYDAARAVWNGTVDRRPAIIVYCEEKADVVTALAFARDHGLPVAVRSGGHSIPGFSVCEAGIVIDLSRMRRVQVDPLRQVARVEAGATIGDVDAATQAYGLVCPLGAVSHTGVAGLTLGGGLGRLMRRFGLTIDNLAAVDLVTAEGQAVRASEESEPELFWALRGAGANFGIATAFEFRLHPLGTVVTAGELVFVEERAADVTELVARLPEEAPDDLLVSLSWNREPGRGDRFHVVCGVVYAGRGQAADGALRPLRALVPVADTVGEVPYLQLQSGGDEMMAWGRRYFWKGAFLDRLTPGLADVAVERTMASPGICGVSLMTLGGAITRVADDATAFSARGGRFWLSSEAVWDDPRGDDVHAAWGRESMAAFRPFSMERNYVNDMGRTDADALRAAYGDRKHQRLVALKRRWDPDNVFRLNHNLDPSPDRDVRSA